jgi:hypothetical protein
MRSRESREKSKEHRGESRKQGVESREQRVESREQRAESREHRAESREQRAESRTGWVLHQAGCAIEHQEPRNSFQPLSCNPRPACPNEGVRQGTIDAGRGRQEATEVDRDRLRQKIGSQGQTGADRGRYTDEQRRRQR